MQATKSGSIKIRLQSLLTLSVLLLLLLGAQIMGGGLSLVSFEQLHLDGVVSGYDAIGAELAGKIERSLRLGKPLDNFIGMDKLLQRGQQLDPSIANLAILTPDARVLYTQHTLSLPDATRIAEAVDRDGGKFARAGHSYYLHNGNEHYLLFPLPATSAALQGYLCLSFAADRMDAREDEIIYSGLLAIGTSTLVAALLLVGGFYFIFNHTSLQRSWIIYLFLFVVLGGAQLGFGLHNINLFQKNYVAVSRDKTVVMAAVLKHDVSFLLERGLPLTALYKIDQRMAQTVARVPEIARMDIVDSAGTVIYHAGSDASPTDSMVNKIPLLQGGEAVGAITIALDAAVLQRTTKEIALNALTIVALSFLFIMEVMVFLFATLLAPLVQNDNDTVQLDSQDVLIRPATFVFIFAASLCYSFIPIFMGQLYQPVSGISKKMMLGLPLTMEMLGGALVLIPVGWWIDRRGWHQAFISGAVISVVGALLSGLAVGQFQFIAARTIMGVGYALVWMSAQGFVLLNSSSSHRARAISNVVAGIFSGLICGNAVGAMLAQQFGYREVFYVTAVVIVVALLFVLIFMRRTFRTPQFQQSQPQGQETALWHLFTDPQALLLFVGSLIPYSVAMVALLYYATPLYLKQLGTSQSTIGRVIMLFGLCMIFVAPRVSHFADQLQDKRPLVIAGGVLGAISLMIFKLSNSFWIIPLAVILLGLSVSISAASRNVMTIALPVTQRLGTTRVMGVYRSLDKVGQALGPLLLAALLGYLPFGSAMAALGGAYLVFTLLLWRLKSPATVLDD